MSCALLLAAREAMAEEPCGTRGRPWVHVQGAANPTIVALLRAELSPRGIDACSDAIAGPKPIATVLISALERRVALDVEVRDAVTAKRIGREIDLSSLPPDGRSLATALAIDELLHASWAELSLVTAPPPAEPVPVAVTRSVARDMRPAPAPVVAAPASLGGLAIFFAVDHYAGGQTQLGADARLALALTTRLSATARIGARTGLAVTAADGDIRTNTLLGGLGLSFAVTSPAGLAGADVVARFDLARVTFVATPKPASTAATGSEATALVAAGGRGWLGLGRSLKLALEVMAIDVLRPARASDHGLVVTGISGVGVTSALGIEGRF